MHLTWRTTAPTCRGELEDYVRPLQIGVRCWDEHVEREFLVARLAADHVLWGDAVTDGVSLYQICDNDSEGLNEVQLILSEGTNDIRDDLGIEAPVDSLLFLYDAVFHESVRPYRVGIVDAVLGLLGPQSLAVMWNDVGDLPIPDQVQLGLARVAGTSLVFRHNALTTPFAEAHPLGLDADVVGTRESHRWVREEWRRESRGDEPS